MQLDQKRFVEPGRQAPRILTRPSMICSIRRLIRSCACTAWVSPEQIIAGRQESLISADKEDSGSRYSYGSFLMQGSVCNAIFGESPDIAIRVTGDIGQYSLPGRLLVQPVDRHHRKRSVLLPRRRRRLKNGEVAKITIDAWRFSSGMITTLSSSSSCFRMECDQMPVDVIRQCALSQAGMAETEQPLISGSLEGASCSCLEARISPRSVMSPTVSSQLKRAV